MLRFIKNLFNSILGFIQGIFSRAKKELPAAAEATSDKLDQAKAAAQSKGFDLDAAANQLAEKTSQVAETTSQVAEETTQKVKEFFLEGDEARGYTTADKAKAAATQEKPESAAQGQTKAQGAAKNGSATQKAPQTAATANALNLAKPKVTSYREFSSFGDRRRPGANMSDFLEMARQMRTSS